MAEAQPAAGPHFEDPAGHAGQQLFTMRAPHPGSFPMRAKRP